MLGPQLHAQKQLSGAAAMLGGEEAGGTSGLGVRSISNGRSTPGGGSQAGGHGFQDLDLAAMQIPGMPDRCEREGGRRA